MHILVRGIRFSLFLAVVLCCRHTIADDSDGNRDVVEVTLSATSGRVAWSDIIHALAETGRFDASALNALPGGSINLNGRRSRLAILAIDLALPPECTVDIVDSGDGVEPQLRITFNKSAIRGRTRDIKEQIRERARGETDNYGLRLDEDWLQAADGRPCIVLVHGYNAIPGSLSGLHARLRDEGWSCAVFSYPDDGPIDESAALLARELEGIRRDHPDRNVAVIAHSMGGLVARAVIEDADLDPGNVRRLIMVCTPNQGSMLAHFPGGFDCLDHLKDGPDEGESFFVRAAADGFNEAASDLRPESEFLRQLNARERNPGVQYTLLLGTKAPLSDAELDEFRRVIASAVERSRLLRFVSPRIEEPLADLDELLDGRGDGAVAVKRGRLDGVEHTRLLPVTHLTITRRADDPAAEELLDAILSRLEDAPDSD